MAFHPPWWRELAYSAHVCQIPSTIGCLAGSDTASTAYPFVTDAGASRLFPPQHSTVETARDEVQHLVRRDPRSCGCEQTRWSLEALRHSCAWLRDLSLPGVHQLLDRLDVVWKRARFAIRSPDPHYTAKRADIAALLEMVRAQPGRLALVYLDEVSIERQPSLSSTHAERAADQPRAKLSHTANTLTRVVGTLDALTAKVVYRRASKIRLATLVQFYQDLRAAYPDAERIYVVQDNWPIHMHPDVLVALEPQTTRWPFYRPRHWSSEPSAKAVAQWGQLQLPIQIVPLPTYASWCNPIEKLWRKLRQELTHLHQWADDLARLRAEIDRFLDQFADGSDALLRYVGLSIPD